MATWYRLERWKAGIEPVEVVKETPQQVVYIETWFGKPKESRAYKAGEFFPTFEAAKGNLISRYEREVERKLDGLSVSKQQLKIARELTL